MIKILKKLPADKIPPCKIYTELVTMTGLRNNWTCKKWIEILEKEGLNYDTKK